MIILNEKKIKNNKVGLTLCRVRYCVCGYCNHCHVGGFCPYENFWYLQKLIGKNKNQPSRYPVLPGQSHGGHCWIPGCNWIHC